MNVRLLALTLLIAATAAAQNRAANPISAETSDAMTAAEGSGAITAAPVVPLPEAPAPHRVIDKKFIFVMAALGGAESMRFTSRKLVLDNEFAAGAPWVTHTFLRISTWWPSMPDSTRQNCWSPMK